VNFFGSLGNCNFSPFGFGFSLERPFFIFNRGAILGPFRRPLANPHGTISRKKGIAKVIFAQKIKGNKLSGEISLYGYGLPAIS